MKMKSKIVGSAVLAAIVCGAVSASAATSISINVAYIGSTTGNANNATTKIAQNSGTGLLVNTTNFSGGSVATASAGLTQFDLTLPAVQAVAGLKNYFAVYLDYSPNVSTDTVYGTGFNISVPQGMAPISSTGLVDSTTNKLVLFNPTDSNTGATTWDTIGDFGDNAGDLVGVGVFQATVANAQGMMIGQPGAVSFPDEAGYVTGKGTLIGLFALEFTNNSQVVNGSVGATIVPATPAWWLADGTSVVDDSVFHANSIAIGSTAPTPEPASLGVLALGGLALLARRRK